MHIICSFVHLVRVSDVPPVEKLWWIHVFYKALFCFAIASEQISDGSEFISLLPYQRDLVTCSLRGFLVPRTRKLLLSCLS